MYGSLNENDDDDDDDDDDDQPRYFVFLFITLSDKPIFSCFHRTIPHLSIRDRAV